jgi:hypothetical protein
MMRADADECAILAQRMPALGRNATVAIKLAEGSRSHKFKCAFARNGHCHVLGGALPVSQSLRRIPIRQISASAARALRGFAPLRQAFIVDASPFKRPVDARSAIIVSKHLNILCF